MQTQKAHMLLHKVFTCRLYRGTKRGVHSNSSILVWHKKLKQKCFTAGTKMYKFITFNTGVSHPNFVPIVSVVAVCVTSNALNLFMSIAVFKIIVDTPNFFGRNTSMQMATNPEKQNSCQKQTNKLQQTCFITLLFFLCSSKLLLWVKLRIEVSSHVLVNWWNTYVFQNKVLQKRLLGISIVPNTQP